MRLEEKQVLRDRTHLPVAWREKEWWFTCLHDPAAGLYLSFSFVRTFLAERFRLWGVDTRTGETFSVDQPLFLDAAQQEGVLDLSWRGRKLSVAYRGEGEGRVVLRLEGASVSAHLEILRRWPQFQRRETTFSNDFGLLHWFGNAARGWVASGARRWDVDTTRCYTDHCWGRVPSRTGWHWLAVQDERVALASLVNHGADAQRYTQLLWEGRWVRLDPAVVFDYDRADLSAPWEIVSSDLVLQATPRKVHQDHVAIPPLVPIVVDLHHAELFVEVEGEVRVDGRWRRLEGLTGVMEEHHGRW